MHVELEQGKDDPRFPGSDRRYAHMDPTLLPLTESLKTTVERFMPLWIETIAPAVKSGKNVIIAAHGNSLRVRLSVLHAAMVTLLFCGALCILSLLSVLAQLDTAYMVYKGICWHLHAGWTEQPAIDMNHLCYR